MHSHEQLKTKKQLQKHLLNRKTLLSLQTKSNMTSLSTNTNFEIGNADASEERKDEAVAWTSHASPTFGMWNNVEAKTREDETAKHLAKVKTVKTDHGIIYETRTAEQAQAVLDHMLNQLPRVCQRGMSGCYGIEGILCQHH